MKLLMVDTATIVASAAVMNEEKLMAEVIVNHQKKHSEKLLPAIDDLLKDAGLKIQDMDAFGIVSGPGSFTGLRIGMATVKGFAQALHKPMVCVSTLESLAYNVAYARGLICPILDAQRNEVYTGLYQFEGGVMTTLMADAVMDIDALLQKILEKGVSPVYILGDGVPKYYEHMAAQLPEAVLVKPHLAMNRASSAAMVAMEKIQRGEVTTYADAAPLYIRKSYAEENRKK